MECSLRKLFLLQKVSLSGGCLRKLLKVGNFLMKLYSRHPVSVDFKECLWACTYGFKHFSGLQSSLGITNGNRSHNKPLELI